MARERSSGDASGASATGAERVSWLPEPSVEELPEEVRELVAKARERLGYVPNVVRAYAFRPDRFIRWWKHFQTVMRAPSGLGEAQREMIAVTVSALNRCHYCVISHAAALRELTGDEELADTLAVNHRRARLDPRERAMLDFAAKVTESSHLCEEADLDALRAAGWTDEDVADIAEVTALFNFSNRMANALGWAPNAVYYGLGRPSAPEAGGNGPAR